MIDLFASVMPPGDKRVFEDPRMREMFTDDILNGTEHNNEAIFLDARLFGRDWGFELSGIRTPVHLWYGDSDSIVPIEHGEHMASRIAGSVFNVRPEEGHLGGLGASDVIFDALLGEWDAALASAKPRAVARNPSSAEAAKGGSGT